MTESTIRAGDTVLHRPSGETWVVAYADHERNDLSAYGWPETLARVTDCELVHSCTDAEHEKAVREWCAKAPGADHRPGAVRRLYGAAFGLALLALLGCDEEQSHRRHRDVAVRLRVEECRADCDVAGMRVGAWKPIGECICLPVGDGGAP